MSKKLPQGWKRVNLKDYISVMETGKRPKGGAISDGIPSLGGEHINYNGQLNVSLDKMKFVPEEYYETLKSGKIEIDDILVVKDGATTGKVGIVKEDFPFEKACINEHLFRIKTDEELSPKYLYYYFKSKIGQYNILKDFRGATVGGISKGFIDMNILLPPLKEQERMVSILERAEGAICKREECNRLLDEYLKSVFVEMFGDLVTNSKGWDKKKLKDFGKVVTGNTPSRKQEEYYGDYIEWIKSDNINTPYHYLTKAEEYLSEEGCNVGRKVPKGSILITCIAGSRSCIGNCAIANREVTFNQQINAIVPNEDVNNNFLYAQLLVGKSVVQSYSTNSMKGMISKGVFENIEFMCPPTELQNKFGEIFDKINEMKSKCEEELVGLNNLFSSLMQRAFKGEL